MDEPGPASKATEGMSSVLRRNIAEMRERRERAAREASTSDRVARWITDFAGSMPFVLVHLALFGGWILVNTVGPPAWRFDPSLVVLAMTASVEAIFLSTFILISQNRISTAERRRAELDLQINLLAEHEVTRLIDLVTRIADRLEVPARDTDLDELRRDVAPGEVFDTLSDADDEPSSGDKYD
jgi:uncharacterized membrane protein